MDIYRESPRLKEDQIRLLRVRRSSATSTEVACDLCVVSLNEQPNFSALSYTWGLPFPQYSQDVANNASSRIDNHKKEDDTVGNETTIEPEHETDVWVLCNSVKTTVGRNLHDFLLHCAKSSDVDLCGLLWVDALCINQSNLTERGHQVEIMSDIYKAASKVIVWLGIDNASTEPAVQLVKALADAGPAERSQRARSSHLSPSHEDILSNANNWEALAQLFERNWLGRAWIIQEVTFARHIVVLCGSHTMKWEDLTAVSGFIAASSWGEVFANTKSKASAPIRRQNVPARLAATRTTWRSSSKDGLLYALIRSRASSCQDPRDKVYSQLRLGNAAIFPDYKASVADVYITTAMYILQRTDNLLLLTCAEGPDFQTVPGLPSWVPDWSITKDLGLRVTGYGSFNADLGLPRTVEVVDNDGKYVLKIDASRVDTISKAGETKEQIQDFSQPTNLWDIISELETTYATKQPREEVLWRTITTNRGHVPQSSTIEYPASKQPIETSFQSWILWRYLLAAKKSPSLAQSAFPIPVTSNSILPTKETILASIAQATHDPNYEAIIASQASLFHTHYSHAMFVRPFRTQKGYLGLGTQSLKENDSVWVVPGCRVPLIFRKLEHGTRYQLIGGTYLHGFMDGQALDQERVAFEPIELE